MRSISATELAKMGKCERQVYFDYHYGEDITLTEIYIEKGNREHEKFTRDISFSDKRCFIATAVFGANAAETNMLRQFRDKRLMVNAIGRVIVSGYYCISPYIVMILERVPVLKTITKAMLTLFIKLGGTICR